VHYMNERACKFTKAASLVGQRKMREINARCTSHDFLERDGQPSALSCTPKGVLRLVGCYSRSERSSKSRLVLEASRRENSIFRQIEKPRAEKMARLIVIYIRNCTPRAWIYFFRAAEIGRV
jgi:hypothetical protein